MNWRWIFSNSATESLNIAYDNQTPAAGLGWRTEFAVSQKTVAVVFYLDDQQVGYYTTHGTTGNQVASFPTEVPTPQPFANITSPTSDGFDSAFDTFNIVFTVLERENTTAARGLPA